MGWSSGSDLCREVISILKDKVEDIPLREEIYVSLIPAFEHADCDTLDECLDLDIAFDNVFKELNPDIEEQDWNEEEDWDDVNSYDVEE